MPDVAKVANRISDWANPEDILTVACVLLYEIADRECRTLEDVCVGLIAEHRVFMDEQLAEVLRVD